MNIELAGGKYILKSDTYCMWLAEANTAKDTGKAYEENVSGYHGTFEGLIGALLRRKILLSETQTLDELKRDIERIGSELRVLVSDTAAKTLTKSIKGRE
jgi:hypothetical protein